MFGFSFRDRSNRSVVAGGGRGGSRIAAIDVGSNSFHLIVTETGPDGAPVTILRADEMVRLGESTLRDGLISDDTAKRGLEALRLLKSRAEQLGASVVIALATSAVREARNGDTFVTSAQRELNLDIRVIDGEEEARLIYLGARKSLKLGERKAALFDLGGGSTEAILGGERACTFATSLKLGVLRLQDDCHFSNPPTRGELLTAEMRVRVLLQPTANHMRRLGFDFVALTSGTAIALARIAERGPHREQEGPTPTSLSLAALVDLERTLAALTFSERAALPGMEFRRVDTILPGAIILRTLLQLTGVGEATVCDASLKEGIVLDHLARLERQQRASRVAADAE